MCFFLFFFCFFWLWLLLSEDGLNIVDVVVVFTVDVEGVIISYSKVSVSVDEVFFTIMISSRLAVAFVLLTTDRTVVNRSVNKDIPCCLAVIRLTHDADNRSNHRLSGIGRHPKKKVDIVRKGSK